MCLSSLVLPSFQPSLVDNHFFLSFQFILPLFPFESEHICICFIYYIFLLYIHIYIFPLHKINILYIFYCILVFPLMVHACGMTFKGRNFLPLYSSTLYVADVPSYIQF